MTRMNQRKSDKETKTTTLRFDSALYTTIQAMAQERSCSLSALVHEAVRAHAKPTAGKGFSARVDALVASGRKPYVSVLTSVGNFHAYHGRIDEERWPEYREYGKLPLLLTFEEPALCSGVWFFHEEVGASSVPAEMSFDYVTSIVEDPGARLHAEHCRGVHGAFDENTRAAAGLSMVLHEEYISGVFAAMEDATDEVDVYERLNKIARKDLTLARTLCGPSCRAVSPRLGEMLVRALDSFQKNGKVRPLFFEAPDPGLLNSTLQHLMWLTFHPQYGAKFQSMTWRKDPVKPLDFETALASGFLDADSVNISKDFHRRLASSTRPAGASTEEELRIGR